MKRIHTGFQRWQKIYHLLFDRDLLFFTSRVHAQNQMLMQIFRSSKRPRELREDAGTSISIAEFQTLVSMQTLFVIVVSMICSCVLTEPGVTKAHQLSTEMRALSTQMSAQEDKTTATVQHILEKLDTVTTYVQSHALQTFHISTGTSDIRICRKSFHHSTVQPA